MKAVKDQVYGNLEAVFGAERITDEYPKTWAQLPVIQYSEEENRVYEKTGEGEERSYVRYRIDIWNNYSTTEAAGKVDAAVGCVKEDRQIEGVVPLGLVRTSCADVSDPSGMKHKVMRFEGIISMDNEFVEWNG